MRKFIQHSKKFLLGLLSIMFILFVFSCIKNEKINQEKLELQGALQQIQKTDYSLYKKIIIDLSTTDNQFNTIGAYLDSKQINYDKEFAKAINYVRAHGINNIEEDMKQFSDELDNIMNTFQKNIMYKIESKIEDNNAKGLHANFIIPINNPTDIDEAETRNNDSLKQYMVNEFSNLQDEIIESEKINSIEKKIIVMEQIEIVKQNIGFIFGLVENIQTNKDVITPTRFWGRITKFVKTVVKVAVKVVEYAAKKTVAAAKIAATTTFKAVSKVSGVVALVFGTADLLCGRDPLTSKERDWLPVFVNRNTKFCEISGFDF